MPSAITSPLPFPSPSQASFTAASPLKRKSMSITQTYYLAHTARGKLSSEAAREDHNLRLLVGHANLLDSLMIELAEAEQEQESWFNQSVRGAAREEPAKHIQWADAVVEEPEEDWQAEDIDSISDDSEGEDDEDDLLSTNVQMAAASMTSLRRVASHTTLVSEVETGDEDYDDDTEEDYAALALTRSPSHAASPPELIAQDSEEEDSSDDESMPPSPSTPSVPSFSEKERRQIATTSFFDAPQRQSSLEGAEEAEYLDEMYHLPPRRAPGLVSAISVY
ncbi:MAG: hypothetical protein M1818_004730 [Claussenomyces sp. TS43310]|nr:MAG: hypothetical protein M1818_004730 [Claussenomyces sp. TS43310]